MKRLKRITAADETGNTALEDAMDELKADFDYALDGLDKLGRSGANASQSALAIAETLGGAIQSALSQIAGTIE